MGSRTLGFRDAIVVWGLRAEGDVGSLFEIGALNLALQANPVEHRLADVQDQHPPGPRGLTFRSGSHTMTMPYDFAIPGGWPWVKRGKQPSSCRLR